jgi:exopolysaccharide biosynthesis polyprenyl glycosylphosphotransferase
MTAAGGGGDVGRIERRKRETWLQFLWVVSDLAAILAAFPAAYWFRFHSPLTVVVPVVRGVPPVEPYLVAAALLSLVWLPLFHAMGLYRLRRETGALRNTWRLLTAVGAAVFVGSAVLFFYRGFSFSRAFVPILAACLFGLMLLGRTVAHAISRRWRERHPLRVAIVGRGPAGEMLIMHLRASDPTGVTICGRLAGRTAARPAVAVPDAPTSLAQVAAPAVATRLSELPVLGTYEDAAEVVTAHALDVLVLALPLEEQTHAAQIVADCRGLPVDVEFVPDLFQLMSRRAGVREIDGLPVLSLREFPLTGWNVVKKRAFDLALSGLSLAVLLPILLLVALLVKLTSPGPVFYRQERTGRDGRRFRILKFRSMREGAEAETGAVRAKAGDRRRTPLGAFLREWSLDELPQLWNVLTGDMSLVGPRPERPHFVREFSSAMPDYLDRHRVKSGITGWAQVNGLRGDTSIEERTRYDLYYVENWSLAFDVRILLLTARAVFGRRGAY